MLSKAHQHLMGHIAPSTISLCIDKVTMVNIDVLFLPLMNQILMKIKFKLKKKKLMKKNLR